jgi:hypothetical protein
LSKRGRNYCHLCEEGIELFVKVSHPRRDIDRRQWLDRWFPGHGATFARILLLEAARVSRRYIVIKDHLRKGPFARATLQAMDWIGNYGHGVALPYNYLSEQEWREHFRNAKSQPRTLDGKSRTIPNSVFVGL